MRFSLTLHILAAGTALKVRRRLALTPGGGSNTNTREALSKFTGTWYRQITSHFRDLNPQQLSILYFRDTIKRRALKSESTNWLTSFLQTRLNLRKKHSRAKSFSAFWLCVNVNKRKKSTKRGQWGKQVNVTNPCFVDVFALAQGHLLCRLWSFCNHSFPVWRIKLSSLEATIGIVYTFGLISMVMNSLKLACGFKECSFFSRVTNHWGARWTFFSRTHLQWRRKSKDVKVDIYLQALPKSWIRQTN